MRITEIQIDRFRIWRNLTLPLSPKGLSVFYGPNEAGKTTVMRFVRAVLYGFSEAETRKPRERAPWRGRLVCTHRRARFDIERTASPGARGDLNVSGFRRKATPEKQLSRLLSKTSEDVFEDIFAIGLRELQQLATMDSTRVADHIYGLSLGPQGQTLLTAMADVQQRRKTLLEQGGGGGQLPDLFGRYEGLITQEQPADRSRENHAALCRRREKLEQRIGELKHRHGVTESNVTGLRHLQRCWNPWHRSRTLQQELNDLPFVSELPAGIFEQLEELDKQTASAQSKRDKSQAALEQIRLQSERMKIDEGLEQNADAIRSLVGQMQWLTDIEERIRRADDSRSSLQNELDQAMTALGPEWTAARLDAVDKSPAAHTRLLHTARSYQNALNRRGKLRRMNRSLSQSTQQELVELNEQLDQLGGLTIEDSIAAERRRLKELEDLGQLKLQAGELEQRAATINKLVGRIDTTNSLPEWIDWIFGVFGVCGSILFVVGLLFWAFGGNENSSLHGALAGAAFGSAGLTWFFFRMGLQNHFDQQTRIKLDDLHEEATATEAKLIDVRQRLNTMSAGSGQTPDSAREVDLIRQTVQRIAELERLGRVQQRVNKRRDRLSTLRARFRTAQQQVTESRQEWCRLLTELGLDETVKIADAFDGWQRIQEVNEVYVRCRSATPESEALRRIYESMRSRVEDLGRRIARDKHDYQRPLAVLTAWKEQLKSLERSRGELSRLQTELRTRQKEIDEQSQNIERLGVQRAALLASAGATSVQEVRQRAEWIELRREHELQLQQVREELNEVVASQPHIALVEDDLLSWDESQAQETIELAELELDEISEQLASAFEQLGSLKHEIESLESSRASLSARFARGQVAGRIHRAAEEWFAVELATSLIDQMRINFEQSNVSSTLAIASEYLDQLTQGRYRRVWAPLGKQRICVDDRYNRTFRVEQLSGGTREQLFLAIRFALVREFSQRGIELPMVMDDLFVNFDEGRTAAAVDALVSFADSGQQVLFFTCHRHLADLFASKGVRPVWLPGPAASRKAEDDDAEEETNSLRRIPAVATGSPAESQHDDDVDESEPAAADDLPQEEKDAIDELDAELERELAGVAIAGEADETTDARSLSETNDADVETVDDMIDDWDDPEDEGDLPIRRAAG